MNEPVFCVDCVYCKKDLKGTYVCHAPFPGYVNLVTGVQKETCSCEYARGSIHLCGQEGRYYKPEVLNARIPQEPKPQGKVKVIAGRGDREVK